MNVNTVTHTHPVTQAVARLSSWGVQVADVEKYALANAHTHGHLCEVMALVRRAWKTPHPAGPAPVIPEQIRRRRQIEEARRFPSHRAEPEPASVIAFKQRAEEFTGPRWKFIDSQAGFRCLLCGNGFGRYVHTDTVMAAAEEHVRTCKDRGGAA
ncbi:hypothetical protein ACWFMI_23985 [Nocardiopsis terrae]|uniref:hypothetical protein n=1 Tax=Streptomyces sp. NPDC057554 TaxID=3350538 RepID=UPI003693A729